MAEEAAKKTNKEIADTIQEQRATARDQSNNNTITSRFMKTALVKIHEGEEDEQSFLLQFPGTTRASDLIDNAQNVFGNINRTYFMQEALKQVVVEPKIKDLAYFDTHAGYSDLYEEIRSFLAERLN